jgi:Protein of unknown function (DUF3072)
MKSHCSKGPGTPGPFSWVPESIAPNFAFMQLCCLPRNAFSVLLPQRFPERIVNFRVYSKTERPMTKPKTTVASNTRKDPDDWVSGDEPMTGAQASYLKTLCEQAHSDAFDENLTKAEASKLIEEMRENAGVSNDETQ